MCVGEPTSKVGLQLLLVPGYLFPFLKVLIHFHVKSYEANLGAVTAGLVVQLWKPCDSC